MKPAAASLVGVFFSGQHQTAVEGCERLREILDYNNNRLEIIAGETLGKVFTLITIFLNGRIFELERTEKFNFPDPNCHRPLVRT